MFDHRFRAMRCGIVWRCLNSALSHDYIGTEHLILGLLGEGTGTATQVLTSFDIRLDEVREELLDSLGSPAAADEDWQPDGLPADCRLVLVWTHRYEDGARQSEGCYENRGREGHWTFWREDGSIDKERTGFYENGELPGEQ